MTILEKEGLSGTLAFSNVGLSHNTPSRLAPFWVSNFHESELENKFHYIVTDVALLDYYRLDLWGHVKPYAFNSRIIFLQFSEQKQESKRIYWYRTFWKIWKAQKKNGLYDERYWSLYWSRVYVDRTERLIDLRLIFLFPERERDFLIRFPGQRSIGAKPIVC